MYFIFPSHKKENYGNKLVWWGSDKSHQALANHIFVAYLPESGLKEDVWDYIPWELFALVTS